MSHHINRKKKIIGVIVLLVVTAFLCRITAWDRYDFMGMVVLPLIRSSIYIVLFWIWKESIKQRIIHIQTKRQLKAISNLIIFWIAIRTIKFVIVKTPDLIIYLWYLYYLPLIMIPLLSLFVSRSIFQKEEYRIPVYLVMLYIPATILLGLVLTNDFHELAFRITDRVSDVYTYGPVYYMIVVWIIGCFIGTIFSVYQRNRLIDKSHRILSPIFILLSIGVYGVLYVAQIPYVRFLMGDFTIVLCLGMAEFYESLFQYNLIPTNTKYKELFEQSSISAVIVDDEYSEQMTTAGYSEIPVEIMKQSEESPIMIEDGLRLSSAKIHGGRVLWEEDISRLVLLRESLETTRLELEENNAAELEVYKSEKKRRQLVEKNRLYDKLQNETREKVDYLNSLLERLENTKDKQEEKSLLLRIAVIGAYIKRRSDLSFLSEEWQEYPSRALENCIGQSLDCLTLFGFKVAQDFRLKENITIENTIRLYEVFEEVIECCLEAFEDFFLIITENEESIIMTFRICTDIDFFLLKQKDILVKYEDGEWILAYSRMKKGTIYDKVELSS